MHTFVFEIILHSINLTLHLILHSINLILNITNENNCQTNFYKISQSNESIIMMKYLNMKYLYIFKLKIAIFKILSCEFYEILNYSDNQGYIKINDR